MTDTPPEPVEEGREAELPEERQAEDEEGSPVLPRGRNSAILLWVLLILLAGVAGIQAAGVLLRDRLEGRTEIGGKPLQLGPGTQTGEPATPVPGRRFGPDVREVVVATPPAASPDQATPGTTPTPDKGPAVAGKAPETVAPETIPPPPPAVAEPAPPEPETAQAPLPQAESPDMPAPGAPKEEAPPAPEHVTAQVPPPQTETPATAAPSVPKEEAPPSAPAKTDSAETAPRREGAYVLQMGVFRSQKYRKELEQRLDALGVPYYRTEGTRSGTGYRITIPASDAKTLARAAAVLADGGYAYRAVAGGLEVRFFLEEEARAAMDRLGKAGFRVGYIRVDGETPLWTVFAGPYDLDEAKAERDRFRREGLDSYLRKRP